jgi:two-component system, OmpR family, sensor histidine kinase SenX3
VPELVESQAPDEQTVALLRAELAAWRSAVADREAMLATMPVGLALFEGEPRGWLRYANTAWVDIVGGPQRGIADLQPPQLRDAVARVAAGEPTAEICFQVGDAVIEAEITVTEPMGSALVVVRDVTAARRTEELRRDFVANASHELKTPVASILGLASALEIAVDDPDATRRFVSMVGSEAQRLSALVTDLLDLSRLESDAGPLHRLDLGRLVDERCEKLQVDAHAAGVALTSDVAPGIQIMGRGSDLGQMVENLLNNAIRYTPSGGRISLTVAQRGTTAVIDVVDTGIGIPREEIPRVFERFYRVDVARDRATGGTGLGLAIVRHVAETHGGQVRVASTVGRGSRFTVSLPVCAGERAGAA